MRMRLTAVLTMLATAAFTPAMAGPDPPPVFADPWLVVTKCMPEINSRSGLWLGAGQDVCLGIRLEGYVVLPNPAGLSSPKWEVYCDGIHNTFGFPDQTHGRLVASQAWTAASPPAFYFSGWVAFHWKYQSGPQNGADWGWGIPQGRLTVDVAGYAGEVNGWKESKLLEATYDTDGGWFPGSAMRLPNRRDAVDVIDDRLRRNATLSA